MRILLVEDDKDLQRSLKKALADSGYVVDAAGDKGKIIVTGLGTPLEMKKYILNGTSPDVILWNPANLGYLAALSVVTAAFAMWTFRVYQRSL